MRASSSARSLATAAGGSQESFASVRNLAALGPWMRDVKPAAVSIAAEQAYFAHAAGPTFVKKDSDKFVMGVTFLGFGVGMLLMLRGE